MEPAAVIDDLLEITVVGSFSRIGYELRRRLFDWTVPPQGALAGRTVLLTGVTSGLGREAAGQLAKLGARLILAGRNEAKVRSVRDELVRTHRDDRFPMVVVDMASLASVREAVDRVLGTEPRLDAVIDNAGAIFPTRQVTADGIESTLATMVVGPFAMVAGLLPVLEATPGARVIGVTSGGQYAQRLHLDDLQWTSEPWDGTRAYARAKRAQVTLMREWARRVPRARIEFFAMHPGWADTPGIAAALPGFHRWMGPLLRRPPRGWTRWCGLPPTRARPSSRGGWCWIAAPDRSTGSRRPASRPPIAVACGTRSSAWPGSSTPDPNPPDWSRHDPTAGAPAHRPADRGDVRLRRGLRERRSLGSGRGVVAAGGARRPAAGGRHRLRARRPDGRPGGADDLPDHALRAPDEGRPRRRRLGRRSGGRHPVRPERRRRDRHRLHRGHPAPGPRPAGPALPGIHFARIGRDAAAGMAAALAGRARSADRSVGAR